MKYLICLMSLVLLVSQCRDKGPDYISLFLASEMFHPPSNKNMNTCMERYMGSLYGRIVQAW